MVLYFLVPIFAIFAYLWEYALHGKNLLSKQKLHNNMIFLAFILPIILFGFRDESIGIDTSTYLQCLDIIHNLSFAQVLEEGQFEFGYTLFCYLVTRLSNYRLIFLILTSLIMNLLYAKGIALLSPMPLTSILIYFFVGNFLYNLNVLRQGIAVGMVLLSLKYLVEGKHKKYILFVIMASFIHTFMIVFIPLVFPVVFIKNRKQLFLFCAIGIMIIFTALKVIEMIVRQFFPHFSYYFKYDTFNTRRFGITSFAYVLMDVFFLILLFMNYDSYMKKRLIWGTSKKRTLISSIDCDAKNIRLINFLCIMLAFGGASLGMINILGIYERIARVFQTFLLLGVPYGIIGINNKYTRYGILAAVLILTFVYYFYIIVSNAFCIVPYRFF